MKLSQTMRKEFEIAKILRFDARRELFLAWAGSDYLYAFDLSGKVAFKVAGFALTFFVLGNMATPEEIARSDREQREQEERVSLRVLRTMDLFRRIGRPNCQENEQGEWEPIKKTGVGLLCDPT